MSAPTIPDSAEGLQDLMSDTDRVNAMLADGTFGPLVAGYIEKVTAKDESIAEQINAKVTETWNTFCAEHGIDPKDVPEGKINRPNLSGFNRAEQAGVTSQVRKQELYNKSAIGYQVDKANIFDDAGEFLRSIHYKQRNSKLLAKRAKLNDLQNAYSSQVPDDGGFLVPESVRSEIMELALETSLVRPRASVIPMDSLRVSMPVVDETSRVTSIKGGLIAGWTEEGASLEIDSAAKFGRVMLEAKKLTSYAAPPNELLNDAPAFRAWFQRSFPSAVAWFEDLAYIDGSGTGEPLGFLRAAAAVAVAKESGQAAATIVLENILRMYARMLPTSLGSAVWIANLDTFVELMTMALTVGTGGSAVMLTNLPDGPPLSILGRPVFLTEKVPTVGTVGDLNFVDLSYYLIGDRQTMQVDSSEHYRFGNDQTAFRVIQRSDGRPWINSALTPNKGAATLSPFVKVATRA